MIDETIEEIREMRTHSSSVVAVKATRALGDLLEREFASVEDFERALEHNAGALRRANTSHATLHNAMRDVIDSVVGQTQTVEASKTLLESTIDRVAMGIESRKREAATNAAEELQDGTSLLTHAYSSTVLEAIEQALAEGTELTIYVTEARPRYLGRRTARELASLDGVDLHLLVDGAAGYVLPEVDRVVIGMDCIVGDTFYNRIGTFPLIAAATLLDVPVTAVGSGAKIIDEGFRFENEIRSPSEVMLEPVDGIYIENPSYDATPVDLLDQIITDDGVLQF
jgi:translation initiation factor eIF-2B subunit delta